MECVYLAFLKFPAFVLYYNVGNSEICPKDNKITRNKMTKNFIKSKNGFLCCFCALDGGWRCAKQLTFERCLAITELFLLHFLQNSYKTQTIWTMNCIIYVRFQWFKVRNSQVYEVLLGGTYLVVHSLYITIIYLLNTYKYRGLNFNLNQLPSFSLYYFNDQFMQKRCSSSTLDNMV